ncbi:Protein CBG22139 [Caenorhabditis briggsae]|uniref:Protein CBG22139 n=1 Tax=Caenorhabditis briggsae TaxID=6238 RepID=A8Y1M2_CAEBR|nr:Protein CBG22139 [Caenorhabditis briggsae]CAP38792.1 Protein CBG22139 [Caenorhabditis briggsae]
MPKVRQFSVHELENNGKIFISIVFDEIVTHISSDIDSNLVKIERSGKSEKTETGDIHQIASDICNEFIENGLLESENFQIDKTKIPVPSNLQKIRCSRFSSAFLGDQKVIKWLEKLDGDVEILKLTENGVIKGLGTMEQLKNVTKELIAVGCDISDEELENLRDDYCRLVLHSEKLTEKGVKRALENYLEQPQKAGNVFDVRFKASSTDFDKNDLFKGLMKAEITWEQYFSFKISYSLNCGKILEYDGFYFDLENGLHSVKIMIPMDWKPRLRDGNTV